MIDTVSWTSIFVFNAFGDSHRHKVQGKLQKTVEMERMTFKFLRNSCFMPGNVKNFETLKTIKFMGWKRWS
jgi:hypothetical protein